MSMGPTSKFVELLGLHDTQFRLVTSPWVTPLALFYIRFTLTVYAIAAGVFDLFYNVMILGEGDRYYTFFTRMSYIAITIYLASGALNTWLFARSLQKARLSQISKPFYPLQTLPKPFIFLYMLLWTTVAAFPPMVTAVFWLLLAKGNAIEPGYHLWSNISFHALNSVFVLVELFLSRTPLLWIYAPVLPVIGLLYFGVSQLVHATQGFYPYPFLDSNVVGNKVPLFVAGVGLASVLSFAIMWGLSRLRDWLRPTASGVPPSRAVDGEMLCITISKESTTKVWPV